MSRTWHYIKTHVYGAATILAVALCIIGSCLANLAQTDFGKVDKENLIIESSSGHRLGINMLKPDTATDKTPAPTIVFSHGGNGMKEKWDNYQIEWARRGFVVLSFDLYGMGDSESSTTPTGLSTGAACTTPSSMRPRFRSSTRTRSACPANPAAVTPSMRPSSLTTRPRLR